MVAQGVFKAAQQHTRPHVGSHWSCAPHRARQRRLTAACCATASVSKADLLASVEGTNRGIFGVQSAKQAEIHAAVEALEARNPCAAPTADLAALDGRWRLLYSTIRILGTRRSKLGLREFVSVGDLWQDIDAGASVATNVVDFAVSGFGQLRGSLTIRASFEVVSEAEVAVTFQDASLEPAQLNQLFQQHYDLLLSIFNPEGALRITYLDGALRIGRDDKGNIFVLERPDEL